MYTYVHVGPHGKNTENKVSACNTHFEEYFTELATVVIYYTRHVQVRTLVTYWMYAFVIYVYCINITTTRNLF